MAQGHIWFNLLFTMTSDQARSTQLATTLQTFVSTAVFSALLREAPKGVGGAGRDRTDDLKLAKLPLSQLSYSPIWNAKDRPAYLKG